MSYIPRIHGCVATYSIVKILLLSRRHALINACLLENSKNFNTLQEDALTNACLLENSKIFYCTNYALAVHLILKYSKLRFSWFSIRLMSSKGANEVFQLNINQLIKPDLKYDSQILKPCGIWIWWRYSWLQFTNNNVNAVSLARAHR